MLKEALAVRKPLEDKRKSANLINNSDFDPF